MPGCRLDIFRVDNEILTRMHFRFTVSAWDKVILPLIRRYFMAVRTKLICSQCLWFKASTTLIKINKKLYYRFCHCSLVWPKDSSVQIILSNQVRKNFFASVCLYGVAYSNQLWNSWSCCCDSFSLSFNINSFRYGEFSFIVYSARTHWNKFIERPSDSLAFHTPVGFARQIRSPNSVICDIVAMMTPAYSIWSIVTTHFVICRLNRSGPWQSKLEYTIPTHSSTVFGLKCQRFVC